MVKRGNPGWLMALGMTVLVSGCQLQKSASPLSPSVAGPIAGVNISKPNLLEPGQDWSIQPRDQPVKLMFQNADTSGERALFYRLEVATDAEFKSIVFTRTGVQPGNGVTTFQLPDALPAGRTYWWRVRAEDGANIGEYSKPVSFVAVAPVVIQAPTAVSPAGTITTLTPEFRVRAGEKVGPAERITYTVQVSNNQAFSSIAALFIVDENGAETVIAQNYAFLGERTYYWRVQARDTGDSRAVSSWSSVQTFRIDEPEPPPPPTPPPPPPLPPPGGDWTKCGSTPGKAIVECVHATIRPKDEYGAFEVVKRVAWLLRGGGAGLMIKEGGVNIVKWRGYTFGASRMMYKGGHYYKIVSDVGRGGENGPSWQDEGQGDPNEYVPAIDPNLP